MTERPPAPPASDAAALAACPHLRSVDGPWHAATPSRAHRCALLAQGRPTLDRQRSHCLVAEHVSCPTWLDAHGPSPAEAPPGPFVRTSPVVLEGPGVGLPPAPSARRLIAPITGVVVALALGALLLSRGPFAPGSPGAAGGPSASPGATASAIVATPSAAPTAAATAAPTARPSAKPKPTPTARPTTYRVQPGDNLSSIAARFGTTVKKLSALNNLANPSLIRVGQVLKLP